MITHPNPKVCIAIPTINELNNIRILIPSIRRVFPFSFIIIIDDASTDGTNEYLDKLMLIDSNIYAVYRKQRLGIGSAHIASMEFASNKGFEFLITMDGDLTHSPYDAYKLIESVQNNDLVIGSRYLGKDDIQGWNWFRVILTRGSHLLTKLLFQTDIDMSSGLRAYRVSEIPLKTIQANCPANYDFFFTSALVFIKRELRIDQVRVILENRASGKSKMNISLILSGIAKLLAYGLRIKRIKY